MKQILSVLAMALAASAAQQPAGHPFHSGQLRTGTDSFALFSPPSRPTPAGYVVQSVLRDRDSIRIVVDYDLGRALRQRVEMLMSGSTLAPISHAETAQSAGRAAVRAEVRFRGGRAVGDFLRERAPVDAPIDAGVIDDEAATALLTTLPLVDGYRTSFQTFASPGRVETTRLSVLGRDTITVPAGHFETFRVEVMGRDTSHIFITTRAPRRVVLVRLLDGSGEMRLLR